MRSTDAGAYSFLSWKFPRQSAGAETAVEYASASTGMEMPHDGKVGCTVAAAAAATDRRPAEPGPDGQRWGALS